MDILLRFADQVEQHTDELALLETLDMGKPISDVLNIDLPEVLRTIRYFAECIDKMRGRGHAYRAGLAAHDRARAAGRGGRDLAVELPDADGDLEGRASIGGGQLRGAQAVGTGTACRVCAWPICSWQAGGPAGVFNVVNGLGTEAGKALALHPDVAKLTFTGSTAVGKLLLGYAGQSNMKRVALETGGKSPQIFFADLYDLDAAVDRAIGGIFDNAGQVCNAGSRLLVQRDIHDAFVARFVERSAALYRPGDPLDPSTTMGPVVGAEHRRRVIAHLTRAQSEGAHVALGGPDALLPKHGAFVAPTLFTGTDANMAINREEVFGPVTSVTVFDTEEEALALANDSVYGLAASVWTGDLNKAHRMVGALEAGVVWVNCFGDGDMTQPFGGYKQSGNSRDKHMDSMLSYMQGKSAWFSLG